MKKYVSNIFKVLTDILIFIIIIFIIFILYGYFQINIKHKSYVNYFGYTFFEVASGSMSPSIEVNDLVIIKLNDNKYKTSDIITYINGKDYITHRIYSINNDEIITKGDNNNSVDSPISKKDILGKVIYIIPEFGIWRNVILNPKVIISLFITIILFGIYFNIDNFKRNKNRGDSIEKK